MKLSITIFLFSFFYFSTIGCGKSSDHTLNNNSGDTTHTPKDTVSGKHISWDQSTLTLVASNGVYARIFELNNENLFCVYESSGNIAFVQSNDKGATWSASEIIVPMQSGINMSTPDVIELKDHSILVAYNPRPVDGNDANPDTSKHYAIRTIRSDDNGVTWKDDRLVYQADYRSQNGCWEPALAQLPGGEIQLYFSNEGIYTHSDEQNISLFRSEDNGVNWTPNPEIAAFTSGHRDGMPVPLVIPEQNEILFSIEDNVVGQFKPYTIRNTFSQNWQQTIDANSTDREYALKDRLSDNIYAGAPYLVRLKTGETLLSFQSTANRGSQWDLSCMNVAVGDSTGRNFSHISIPFNIPTDKHGLWNSLCVMDDSTIIAVTSTNAYSDHDQIWTIKGHLIN